METKSFVKLLRKVIREEVKNAVKDVLNEQKAGHKQVINHGMDLHKMVEQRPSNPVKKKKTFTKNSMLNDLLNETATTADFSTMRDGPLVSQTEEYPTMGDKKWNSSLAETFGMERAQPQALATTDTNGKPVDMSNETVANTVNIMTKDYSALMKAIDKKKGVK